MLVSLNWLNDYCDLSDLSAQEIAEILTQLGHEVEKIEQKAPIPTGVIVGEIKTAMKHPKADTLKICEVDVGQDELLKIVCGAPNARSGIRVAVATVGTKLSEDFKIKVSKIRGEQSNGMLCSEKELGLSDEHDGILEIELNCGLGEQVSKYVKTGDFILDLSLTPNRSDCLGLIGIAREISAKLGRELKVPKICFQSNPNLKSSDVIKVKVASDAGCGRFTAFYVKNVKAIASPSWLQNRLQSIGMRPINLLVDITNYVMMETGQPLHAYDANFLEGKNLQVRSATLNEKLTLLNGSTVKLEPGDLLICDQSKPIGLAGIMGGENSEVKETTTDIVVEVAHFHSEQIRKTSKRLGLHTEASHRFERGIDMCAIDQVSKRVGQLIEQCLLEMNEPAPSLSSEIIDYYPKEKSLARVAMRLPRLRALLSLPQVTLQECADYLSPLEFKLIDKTDERMLFEIPSFRNDVVREVDLIEEVCRMIGFEKIPYSFPRMKITPNKENPLIGFLSRVKITLAQLGLSEVISFPFQSNTEYSTLGITKNHPLSPRVTLANPLNEEMSVLQTTLIPSLLNALIHNRNHQQNGSKLFELGRAYFDFAEHSIDKEVYPVFSEWGRSELHLTSRAKQEKSRVTERSLVSGVLDSPYRKQMWGAKGVKASFFHGKALIESLCSSFGGIKLSWTRPLLEELPFLHPGASACILANGRYLGYLGELHPKTAYAWGFSNDPIVIFEIDVEVLFWGQTQGIEINPRINKFPSIARDFAFLVDEKTDYGNMESVVENFPKRKYLKHMELFDLYQGEHLPNGKKSMAATFIFESDQKTLTDKEVEKESGHLLQWLNAQLGAELR